MELFKEIKKTETFSLDGNDYEFYVREPNTDDRIQYLASIAKKVNGKIQSNLKEKFKIKYELGCALITGFPENNSEGKPQFQFKDNPVSSDPDSENYRKDWGELILPNFINQIMIYQTKIYDHIDLKNIKTEPDTELIPESEELSDETPFQNK